MMSRILPKVRILSAVHLQTRLFLCPRNQQMVTERQLKAFNEIGLGDFAARDDWALDWCSLGIRGFVMTPDCGKYHWSYYSIVS